MYLFYADSIENNKAFIGKEESHHATRVLKLQTGSDVLVTQGKGIIYEAKITSMAKNALQLSIGNVFSQEEQSHYLHIAIGPTKSLDRFEFFLEKATEIGVDEITPIICFHSERKVYKTERGRKVILSAAKQSLSNWLPKLNEPVPFSKFISSTDPESTFIAHCDNSQTRKHANVLFEKKGDRTILIGPEGDFSQDEILKAKAHGIIPVELGAKRLRTETAGMVAAMLCKIVPVED